MFATPDFSPNPSASLEWWFLQGHFRNQNAARSDFMVSVFRHASGADRPDGYMLLVSLLREGEEQHQYRSEISPTLFREFIRRPAHQLDLNASTPHLVRSLQGELERYGLPDPLSITSEPEHVASDDLDICWADLSLRREGERIHLAFELPEGGRCELAFTPLTRWFSNAEGDDKARYALEGSMIYQSCPRFMLEGSCAGEAVTGQGWMDHQWGETDWMQSHDGHNDMLSWDWLGINLDNGEDLIVMQRRNRRTGATIDRKVLAFAPDADHAILEEVILTPMREWQSPHSLADYSIEWQIKIPALGIELQFEPQIDDQEVPVFGVMNAIWEGTGEVHGTARGKAVTGQARLELQGYSNCLDVRYFQDQWVERIDQILRDFLPAQLDQAALEGFVGPTRWQLDADAQTKMLAEPVWNLLDRGGKHWRPIYGFLMMEILGEDAKPFETFLSAIAELIHNGSVIIDDIEDDSETRRGDPCTHRIYGLPASINVGNMLYFLPILSLGRHAGLDAEQREEIYELLMRVFVCAHMGQGQDLYWSHPNMVRDRDFWLAPDLEAKICQAHAFKTAALIKALSEIVAIIAKADQKMRAICRDFSETLGLAFQIVDDVNNFTKRPEWGKRRGEDLAAGKVTYVTRKAVTMLPADEQAELIALLNDPHLRNSDHGLTHGIHLIERSGALDAARSDAKAMVEAAWPTFSTIAPQSSAKLALRLYITHLLNMPLEM